MVNRILRRANGEKRLVNAALVTLNHHGWSNYDTVMKDLRGFLETHPECRDRIIEAVDQMAGFA